MGKVPKMNEKLVSNVKHYKDYRKLLSQKDIDAVCIATPDHWHALQTIHAFEADKHVYVEKPLTITIKEGREMINFQKKYGKVCAVGLNRRGSPIYQKLANDVQSGLIGKVTTARAQRTSNMYPTGIGILEPEAPPKDFDWNMWLGPRAYKPYKYNMAPYFFRWWKEYSSQMGNWGVHYMDVIRWMMGESAPVAITATGGKYAVEDDRNIPDTMEVLFEMPSPWYRTEDIQNKIKEAHDADCNIALDLTWLPVTNAPVHIDLSMVDQVFFSMNKCWPLTALRPALRWSKNRINDSQTFDNEFDLYPKIPVNMLMILVGKIDFDYTFNLYADKVNHLCEKFRLEKTNVLWFTKHKDIKHNVNNHISNHYHLDEFVCVVELLEHTDRYFW